MESASVLVVGSLNMDLVVPVPRHPNPGETVVGGDLQRFPGGKGANQAVAAVRLGASVRMLGRVGSDAYGEELVRGLEAEGVDTEGVRALDAPTGVALISVSQNGQNAIVVSPGANARLRPEDLEPAAFAGAAVVVLQLETPLETVARAAQLGREAGARVLLNAAPAKPLPGALWNALDVLVVNEYEAAQLTGGSTPEDAEAALVLARELAQRAPVAVVTLGERGLVWAGAEGEGRMPAYQVEAVDTTAAGDAFVGGVAAALAASVPLEGALRFGAAAGALTATHPGAQPSLPRMEELQAMLMVEAIKEGRAVIEAAETSEVERRAPQISRLLEVIGFSTAWVSDLSTLRHFAHSDDEHEEIVQRIRRAYGVSLRSEDFDLYLWQLVDELERRPRA